MQLVDATTTALGPLLGGVLVAALRPEPRLRGQRGHLRVLGRCSSRSSRRGSSRASGRSAAAAGATSRRGSRVVRHSRALVCVLVVWSTVMLAGGIVNVAEVFLARQAFHAGDFGFGLLWTGSGIGLVLGGLDGGAADRAGHRQRLRPLHRRLLRRPRLRRRGPERLGRGGGDGPRRLRQRRRRRRQHHARPARRPRPRARARVHPADERELRRARASPSSSPARSRTPTAPRWAFAAATGAAVCAALAALRFTRGIELDLDPGAAPRMSGGETAAELAAAVRRRRDAGARPGDLARRGRRSGRAASSAASSSRRPGGRTSSASPARRASASRP